MAVVKIAISLEKGLAKQIRDSAGPQSISAWLAEAAKWKLRFAGLSKVVQGWEAEHGEITEEELRETKREQQITRRRVRRR